VVDVGTCSLVNRIALLGLALLVAGCQGETLGGNNPTGSGGGGGDIVSTGEGGVTGRGGAGTGGVGGDGVSAGGATGAGGDCAIIVELPPIVAVEDPNGQPLCDLTFTLCDTLGQTCPTVISDLFRCDGTTTLGCPPFPATETPAPCIFALTALSGAHPSTIKISSPGYSDNILQVAGGEDGCGGSYPAPTHTSAVMFPTLPLDAGAGPKL
jgi:hypothetical protein